MNLPALASYRPYQPVATDDLAATEGLFTAMSHGIIHAGESLVNTKSP